MKRRFIDFKTFTAVLMLFFKQHRKMFNFLSFLVEPGCLLLLYMARDGCFSILISPAAFLLC